MDISLHDLVLRHPGQTADLLRVGDRTVNAGSSVVIRGASGCGKTTLLHVIAGLLSPAEGSVRLAGQDIFASGGGARARRRRTRMGIVFQRLNLLDHLTALENVRLGKPGVPRDEAAAALSRMGLADIAGRPGELLSLGEQQRVAVARVLASRPDLILADEPTSALDDANAERVLGALQGEVKRGATVVVVTHDHRVDDHFGTLWQIRDGEIG